ncbi:hypothetical protein BIW11_04165, partial [Tropilaelaps mercedesae]
MIPVNSLLQQGAIATSVNGMPVLIIKNHQTGQQQIVHMRQVQHVQTLNRQQLASPGGAQLAVLRQAPGGLKQQTVVVTQSGQQNPPTLNRVPIQVTLPVGPTGGQQIVVPSSQANSGASPVSTTATPVTVVTTSGVQPQQVQLLSETSSLGFNQTSGAIQAGSHARATQIGCSPGSVVVSTQPTPIVSQSGGLFSTGGQPITVSIASSTTCSSI